MEADFWHQKWERGELGFHLSEANPLLVQHFSVLGLQRGQTVLLPLCGKTRDMVWLLEQGYQVRGAELSQLAVEAFFAELGVTPEMSDCGALTCYQAESIAIYCGDFFSLQPEVLGAVDAVYDRAALVALPPDMRSAYTQHLRTLSGDAPQLLIAYEYDQLAADGPPFAILPEEVSQHYAPSHHLQLLNRVNVEGGLKGKVAATEAVWHLTPLQSR